MAEVLSKPLIMNQLGKLLSEYDYCWEIKSKDLPNP